MDNEEIVFEAIYARRSIRIFDDKRDVEHLKIKKLLNVAMSAPSACNIQPWEFIVVKMEKTINEIKDLTGNNGNYNPNVIIVICGNNKYIPWKDNGVIDCAAAMENMLIAAPTLGLGTVVIGGFDKAKLKILLEIPNGVEPICLVYLGYPKEDKASRSKYEIDAVHWEIYNNTRQYEPRPGNILVFGAESSL